MTSVASAACDRKRTVFAEPTDPLAQLSGDSLPPPEPRRVMSPMVPLWLASVEDAIALVLGKVKADVDDLAEAIAWIADSDDEPFGFVVVAQAVGIDGAAVREQLADAIEAARRRLPPLRLCAVCGDPFWPRRRNRRRARYCSLACVRRRGPGSRKLTSQRADSAQKAPTLADSRAGGSGQSEAGRRTSEDRP